MKKYSVLYTKHLTRKSKVWNDGVLFVASRKVSLFNLEDNDNAAGYKEIDSLFVNSTDTIAPGEHLTMNLFLVDIIDLLETNVSAPFPPGNDSGIRAVETTKRISSSATSLTSGRPRAHCRSPSTSLLTDAGLTKAEGQNNTSEYGIDQQVTPKADFVQDSLCPFSVSLTPSHQRQHDLDKDGSACANDAFSASPIVIETPEVCFPTIRQQTKQNTFLRGLLGSIASVRTSHRSTVGAKTLENSNNSIAVEIQPSDSSFEYACSSANLDLPNRELSPPRFATNMPPVTPGTNAPPFCSSIDQAGKEEELLSCKPRLKLPRLSFNAMKDPIKKNELEMSLERSVMDTSKECVGASSVDEVESSEFCQKQLGIHIPAVDSAAAAVPKTSAASKRLRVVQPRTHDSQPLVKVTAGPADFFALRFLSSASQSRGASNVTIPNSFESLDDYRSRFIAALAAEVNFQLDELARSFSAAAQSLTTSTIVSVHSGSRLPVGQSRTCQAPMTSAVFKSAMRSAGINFYHKQSTELIRSGGSGGSNRQESKWQSKAKWKKRRRKEQDGDENDADSIDDDAAATVDPKPVRYFLKICEGREHSSKYAKDDLWIVCSTESFDPDTRGHFLLFFASIYHGPTSQGMLELFPVGGGSQKLSRAQHVFAIRGPNIANELSMLNVLRGLSFSLPILPAILRCPSALELPPGNLAFSGISIPLEEIERIADSVVLEFELNDDQRSVLVQCSKWLKAEDAPPVVLVHGTFGSGKSFLLVAIIVFLCKLLSQFDASNSIRIMVAAQTNVAVDRVLMGLLDRGFSSFARVGSLRKISKSVLPYVLHYSRLTAANRCDASSGQSQADRDAETYDALALKELNGMLSSASVHDRLSIETAIAELKAEQSAARARRLKRMRVVGATCLATEFSILDGNRFAIVIVDESSQIIEPMSLLPLARFGCERLLAVGDPKQLPPTLASTSSLHDEAVVGTAQDETLSKALFVRLSTYFEPILLRTQYRCHPELTCVPNALFYQGKLIDGVDPSERAPLVAGLPPLVFCNVVSGREQRQQDDVSGTSVFNETEVRTVTAIVGALLSRGVLPRQIGVIATYSAQCRKLQESVEAICRRQEGSLMTQRDTSDSNISRKHRASASLVDDEVEESGNCEDRVEKDGAVNDTSDFMPVTRESEMKEDGERASSLSTSGSIQVSTVDAFQGAERDIIVVSFARTQGVGFLKSPRRLNVALTRARNHLILVGNSNNLSQNRMWNAVIAHARKSPNAHVDFRSFLQLLNCVHDPHPSSVPCQQPPK